MLIGADSFRIPKIIRGKPVDPGIVCDGVKFLAEIGVLCNTLMAGHDARSKPAIGIVVVSISVIHLCRRLRDLNQEPGVF
jgi:hypothetical protein